ncbi:MAG: hypothetical protein NT040_07205 [Bacteroidetes bacterium]|nr:hypothetical protein [Bacteroidota bacterium]
MKRKYLYLFVFLFGTALYINTLPNKYAYDDFSVVAGNRYTTAGLTGIFGHLFNDSFTGFTGQKNLFRGGRYRPLSLITFSIEYQFFGANPFVSHLVNVILYGLICMLLFKVLAALFQDKLVFKKYRDYFLSLSLMAALLFAAHPIHTEVAANIKGRDELMALLFGLLAWNSIIIYTDKAKPVQAFYGGLFFFLSLMSKESAAPFLLLIPLSVYCFRSKPIFRKSVLVSSLSLFTGFAVFMFIRQSVLGWNAKPTMEDNILSNSFMYASGLSERYGTTLYTLWLYLKLLFVPHPLTIDYYPYYIPYVGLTDIRAILPLLLYAGLVAAALYYTFRKNAAGFGLLFYLVALFPVSNILFIIGPFMGERFAFIPSVGFTLALAWILIRIAEQSKSARALPYVMVMLLLLYSGKTISRNFDWKDSFTLYTQDVLTSVNSAVITKGAGHELLLRAEATKDNVEKRAFAEKAIPYLEQAAKMNKTTTETFLLGNAYYEDGSYEKALNMYVETLRINANYEKALANYIVSVNRISSPALKIKYYDLLIKTAGEKYEAYYYKGLVFGKEMNLLDSSIRNLVRASRIDSTKLDCLSDLGVAFAMKGDFPMSAFYLEKALKIVPNDMKIRQNLAASYYNMGNVEKAKELSKTR